MSPSSGRRARSSRWTRRRSATWSSPGAPTSLIELVDAYCARAGHFRAEDSEDPTFPETLELDLGDVEPSIAGPKRPQDRIALADAKGPSWSTLRRVRSGRGRDRGTTTTRRSRRRSRPRTRRPRTTTSRGKPRDSRRRTVVEEPRPNGSKRRARGRHGSTELDHGRVVIAAITSCTNTSNPTVMIGAGPARQEGGRAGSRQRRPWVKTSLAPGSTVVTDYLEQRRARRVPGRRSASTSSATGARPASATRARCRRRSRRPSTSTTWSSARCSRATATSRAGSTRTCATTTWPRRRCASRTRSRAGWTSTWRRSRSAQDSDGEPVYLRDIWPTREEIKPTVERAVRPDMFTKSYADVFTGDDRWRGLEIPEGDRYTWPGSTYVRQAALLRGDGRRAASRSSRSRARVSWRCSATA